MMNYLDRHQIVKINQAKYQTIHLKEAVSSKGKFEQPEERLFKARKTKNLTSVATDCDRTAVSDRDAAMIVSAVLQNIGEVSADNTS